MTRSRFLFTVRGWVCTPRDWFVRCARAQYASTWHAAGYQDGDDTRAYREDD